MLTLLFPNQPRHGRRVLRCVFALLACNAFGLALAQSNTTAASSGQTKSKVTAPKSTTSKTQTADAANSGSVTAAPTYLGDIQPIFMVSCARCHNQQSRFVYDWLDYKTAFADRWEIKRRLWDSWKGTYYKEPMPVTNSPESLALTDAQRTTIKTWVESGAPIGVAVAQPQGGAAQSPEDALANGKRIFTACAACHQPSGQGVPNVFPPLAGSDFLNADKERAIKIVIHGKQGDVVVNGVKYSNSMPPFPLSDRDIAAVLTYVYSSFGNSGLEVTPDEVKSARAQ